MTNTLKNGKWGSQPIIWEYHLCSYRQAAVVGNNGCAALAFLMWLVEKFSQELQKLFMICLPVQPLVFTFMESVRQLPFVLQTA